MFIRNLEKNRGYAIFISVTVTSVMLLIAFGILNLLLKEKKLTSSNVESVRALYASQTSFDCALYHSLDSDAFDDAATSDIVCIGQTFTVGGPSAPPFTLEIPDDSCGLVQVTKTLEDKDGDLIPDDVTTISSRGYNTCESDGAGGYVYGDVERGIQVETFVGSA
jgi:hypothetical protein